MTLGLRKKHVAIAAALLLLLVSYGTAGMQGIRFSHRLHVEDVEITCAECHPNATTGEVGSDVFLPARGSCADCHDVEDQSACGTCHASTDEPPRCGLVVACKAFSHEQHTRERPECSTCHKGIECAENSRETFRPELTICSECHKKNRLMPSDHHLEWEHVHGRRAEIEPQSCELCHVEREDCHDCHHGDNLVDGTPHALAFLYSHGPEARVEKSRCESCHRDQLFCIECHAGYRVKPLSHDLAGWQGGTHGPEARRHLDHCMTCHVESEAEATCGSCHK